MREKRVLVLVEMDELDPDVAVHAVAIAARWTYFEPHFVYEPSKPPPFLPTDSNRLAKLPR